MPQMAPLPWLTLFTFTIITLLYMSSIIFFSFKETTTKISKMHKKNFLIQW